MWLYRLRWYIRVASKRKNIGAVRQFGLYGHQTSERKLFLIGTLLLISSLCFVLLRSIWLVFMRGFLASTPWVPGGQTGAYYWNSVIFATKSTIIIGLIFGLLLFLLGVQFNKLLRR